MGFLWLFHKSLKKATEFNTSLHVLMPSGFDETIECKPQKTKVMKQGTMNILFFVLKTKLLKNGEAPVLMRITINGDYDDVRIQRSVPLNLWNAAKGCNRLRHSHGMHRYRRPQELMRSNISGNRKRLRCTTSTRTARTTGKCSGKTRMRNIRTSRRNAA